MGLAPVSKQRQGTGQHCRRPPFDRYRLGHHGSSSNRRHSLCGRDCEPLIARTHVSKRPRRPPLDRVGVPERHTQGEVQNQIEWDRSLQRSHATAGIRRQTDLLQPHRRANHVHVPVRRRSARLHGFGCQGGGGGRLTASSIGGGQTNDRTFTAGRVRTGTPVTPGPPPPSSGSAARTSPALPTPLPPCPALPPQPTRGGCRVSSGQCA